MGNCELDFNIGVITPDDILDQLPDEAKAEDRRRRLELQTEIEIRSETRRFRDPPREDSDEMHHRPLPEYYILGASNESGRLPVNRS